MTITNSKVRAIVDPEPVCSCADHIEIIFNKSNLAINFVDLPEDFDSDDAEYLMDSLGAKLHKRSNGELKPKNFKFLSDHTVSLIFDIAC